MKVVVTVPNDYLGNVTGDMMSRRGMIIDTEDRDPVKLVTCEVPLSEMFGYTTSLRGMSQGRAPATSWSSSNTAPCPPTSSSRSRKATRRPPEPRSNRGGG